MKLKVTVCTEDGEVLESDDVFVSTNPADIKIAKMEVGELIDNAIRILVYRSQEVK